MGEGAGVLGRELNATLESSGYEPWQFPGHDNLVLAEVTAREISRGQPAAPFVR